MKAIGTAISPAKQVGESDRVVYVSGDENIAMLVKSKSTMFAEMLNGESLSYACSRITEEYRCNSNDLVIVNTNGIGLGLISLLNDNHHIAAIRGEFREQERLPPLCVVPVKSPRSYFILGTRRLDETKLTLLILFVFATGTLFGALTA